MADLHFDYIVIGSGSSGSALAYRLSESGQNSVLVLEYGGSDSSFFIQMPAALSYPRNMRRYDWGYYSVNEPSMKNRRLQCPRGKLIGGSSSVNGMVFVRGHPQDYARWSDLGAQGWDYEGVLPYFMRMETSHGSKHKLRGNSGPVHVTRDHNANELNQAIIEAATQAGYPRTEDYNAADKQEGFGSADKTIFQGRRWSVANAYLKPALERPNVFLKTHALVDKVLFKGRKAYAVSYIVEGQRKTVHANKEIILSAGSINSPAIMMRSGVGDPKRLLHMGIDMQIKSPEVGMNLQDHLEVYVQMECTRPITLHRYWNPISKAAIGLRWLMFKEGLGASNHFDTLGFVRSSENTSYPDIQYHFMPIAVGGDGLPAVSGHGYQFHVGPMRSKSRGWVQITSSDPTVAPDITFNYMSYKQDWQDFRRCLRISRKILSMPALKEYTGSEIKPGFNLQSDAELDDFVARYAESAYHPCGTMRMGEDGVVDSQCRLIGAENLRVVDSSVFPCIPNGNTNAPSIMLGEKAADLILGNPPIRLDYKS